jgi:hypothetical protein
LVTALAFLAVLQGAPDAFAEHPVGVEIPLGVGLPTGLLGVALDWTPLPYLSLEAGLGVDRSFRILDDGAGGVQWSVMPRLRLPIAGMGLLAGFGVSGGPYGWCDSCPAENGDQWNWSQAIWLNFEGGVEYRWLSGMGLRLSVGVAELTNPDDVTCTDTKYGCADIPPAKQSAQPYFGLSVRIPLW